MVSTGMIYQYDHTQGIGLIMMHDAKTQEFSKNDWADTQNDPAVGQKVSYKNDAGRIEIEVLKEKNATEDAKEEFTSLEESLKHFTDLGFKLLKDTQDGATRTLILRSYTMDEHREATIKHTDAKISVTQTLNGKEVLSP